MPSTMHSETIVLIGFMGTGKSTVGRIVAGKLDYTFADTDSMVERDSGMTIPALFERYGETRFRELETDAVKRAVRAGKSVIATGGGAVLSEENRSAMKEHGFVVALKADQKSILDRVSTNRDRPLLRGDVENKVRSLLESRRTAYDWADKIIDTTGKTPEQVANLILEAIGCKSG